VATSDSGVGVEGLSTNGDAITGLSQNGNGIRGTALGGGGAGVRGGSAAGDGVFGESSSNQHAGVSAINDSGGFGLFARGVPAGHFEGNVEVVSGGDVLLADCAEEFDARQELSIEPGMVMVLDQEGMVEPGCRAYDKRVAGVISGAGNCRPAIVLDKRQLHGRRVPLALLGRVYCKVDAQYASIEVGDLLTTSPTSGHAMKACDPIKGFGAVIGKALRPLESGQGMIPILIALQ
jgi:hypothetical protein